MSVFSALGSLCSSLNCGGVSFCNSTTTIQNVYSPGDPPPPRVERDLNLSQVRLRDLRDRTMLGSGSDSQQRRITDLAFKIICEERPDLEAKEEVNAEDVSFFQSTIDYCLENQDRIESFFQAFSHLARSIQSGERTDTEIINFLSSQLRPEEIGGVLTFVEKNGIESIKSMAREAEKASISEMSKGALDFLKEMISECHEEDTLSVTPIRKRIDRKIDVKKALKVTEKGVYALNLNPASEITSQGQFDYNLQKMLGNIDNVRTRQTLSLSDNIVEPEIFFSVVNRYSEIDPHKKIDTLTLQKLRTSEEYLKQYWESIIELYAILKNPLDENRSILDLRGTLEKNKDLLGDVEAKALKDLSRSNIVGMIRVLEAQKAKMYDDLMKLSRDDKMCIQIAARCVESSYRLDDNTLRIQDYLKIMAYIPRLQDKMYAMRNLLEGIRFTPELIQFSQIPHSKKLTLLQIAEKSVSKERVLEDSTVAIFKREFEDISLRSFFDDFLRMNKIDVMSKTFFETIMIVINRRAFEREDVLRNFHMTQDILLTLWGNPNPYLMSPDSEFRIFLDKVEHFQKKLDYLNEKNVVLDSQTYRLACHLCFKEDRLLHTLSEREFVLLSNHLKTILDWEEGLEAIYRGICQSSSYEEYKKAFSTNGNRLTLDIWESIRERHKPLAEEIEYLELILGCAKKTDAKYFSEIRKTFSQYDILSLFSQAAHRKFPSIFSQLPKKMYSLEHLKQAQRILSAIEPLYNALNRIHQEINSKFSRGIEEDSFSSSYSPSRNVFDDGYEESFFKIKFKENIDLIMTSHDEEESDYEADESEDSELLKQDLFVDQLLSNYTSQFTFNKFLESLGRDKGNYLDVFVMFAEDVHAHYEGLLNQLLDRIIKDETSSRLKKVALHISCVYAGIPYRYQSRHYYFTKSDYVKISQELSKFKDVTEISELELTYQKSKQYLQLAPESRRQLINTLERLPEDLRAELLSSTSLMHCTNLDLFKAISETSTEIKESS